MLTWLNVNTYFIVEDFSNHQFTAWDNNVPLGINGLIDDERERTWKKVKEQKVIYGEGKTADEALCDLFEKITDKKITGDHTIVYFTGDCKGRFALENNRLIEIPSAIFCLHYPLANECRLNQLKTYY